MLKTVLFIIVLLPVTPGAQTSADLPSTELSWNEFYKLKWVDFLGRPDPNSVGDAGTAVAIRAKPFLVRKEVHYDVVAIFNRSKSWVRDKSPSLLAHEQLHFDIAEWYARLTRRKVAELRSQGVSDIGKFNEEIRRLLLESNEVDEQYDLETLHGALADKQAAWVERVGSELTSLEKYRKTRRVIGE